MSIVTVSWLNAVDEPLTVRLKPGRHVTMGGMIFIDAIEGEFFINAKEVRLISCCPESA